MDAERDEEDTAVAKIPLPLWPLSSSCTKAGSACSRSTSAGGDGSETASGADDRRSNHCRTFTRTSSTSSTGVTEEGWSVPGLPEFEYPASVLVKNTFLHTGCPRPLSMESSYEEREIHSCPASGLGLSSPFSGFSSGVGARLPSPLRPFESPTTTHVDSTPTRHLRSPGETLAAAAAVPKSPMPRQAYSSPMTLPNSGVQQLLQAKGLLRQTEPASVVLNLVQASPERPSPMLGSPELPSIGSEPHRLGLECKPCAHVYSEKGCENGVQCQFCHLCPPGELKRRQKSKRNAHGGRAQQQHGFGGAARKGRGARA